MGNKKILVIGSCNTDMVIKSDRLPIPGETVIGGTFLMNAGGSLIKLWQRLVREVKSHSFLKLETMCLESNPSSFIMLRESTLILYFRTLKTHLGWR